MKVGCHSSPRFIDVSLTLFSPSIEEGPQVLPEMLEDIHVVLFLVFGIFMLQILVLLFFAHRQGRKWRRAEKVLLKRKVNAKGPQMSAQELFEFEAIRTQFVHPLAPRPGFSLILSLSEGGFFLTIVWFR